MEELRQRTAESIVGQRSSVVFVSTQVFVSRNLHEQTKRKGELGQDPIFKISMLAMYLKDLHATQADP